MSAEAGGAGPLHSRTSKGVKGSIARAWQAGNPFSPRSPLWVVDHSTPRGLNQSAMTPVAEAILHLEPLIRLNVSLCPGSPSRCSPQSAPGLHPLA